MDAGAERSNGKAATNRPTWIATYVATTWRAARSYAGSGIALGRTALASRLDGGYAPIFAGAESEPPDISVVDFTVSYPSMVAIEGVTGTFPPRSMTAIVGPNGAGKSTLLKAIAGIILPEAGTLSRGGAGLGDIAYLPQSDEIERGFPVSVAKFVSLGGWRQFGAFRPADRAVAGAGEVLALVGLADVSGRLISSLSEGQFRRALFARMALQQARVLLLDEPFAAIDAATTADLVRLVEHWHGNGCTIIAVLHDLTLVRDHFPLVLLLARRVISWGETHQVLIEENLARVGLGAMRERNRLPGLGGAK